MKEPVQRLRRIGDVIGGSDSIERDVIHWVALAIEKAAGGDPRMLAEIVNDERQSRSGS